MLVWTFHARRWLHRQPLPRQVRILFPKAKIQPSWSIVVHALRPADIQHIAAMGDSLTVSDGRRFRCNYDHRSDIGSQRCKGDYNYCCSRRISWCFMEVSRGDRYQVILHSIHRLVLVVMQISLPSLLCRVCHRCSTVSFISLSLFLSSDIIRKFNTKLTGFSTGTGDRDKSGAGFNVAKAGAVSS